MGGLVNDGFNLVRHNLVEQTKTVIEHWPTPLVISQHGHRTITGAKLCDAPAANPVREGYYRWGQEQYKGRCSWDQVAVLYGVRGVGSYFKEITEGSGRLRSGYEWSLKQGSRSFLKALLSDREFEAIIEPLMIKPPDAERKKAGD
jgi:hypothetical protein